MVGPTAGSPPNDDHEEENSDKKLLEKKFLNFQKIWHFIFNIYKISINNLSVLNMVM